MTAFAFILGVVPFALAKGAGAEMRVPLGVAVFSGMLGVTFFGLVFTPVFYWIIMRFAGKKHSGLPSMAPEEKTTRHEQSWLHSRATEDGAADRKPCSHGTGIGDLPG